MLRLLKNRVTGSNQPLPQSSLGRLELGVMEILWIWGESSVRDLVQKLDRPLAYTTVMTTLDRLYKKGFLARRKLDRAFLYLPRLSRPEWERKRASALLASFLDGPEPAREVLVSSFLDAVGQHDESLLKDLEEKIRVKRKELLRRGRP
jgi:predicted transcriptional regulator